MQSNEGTVNGGEVTSDEMSSDVSSSFYVCSGIYVLGLSLGNGGYMV